jgi:hypothetical protein
MTTEELLTAEMGKHRLMLTRRYVSLLMKDFREMYVADEEDAKWRLQLAGRLASLGFVVPLVIVWQEVQEIGEEKVVPPYTEELIWNLDNGLEEILSDAVMHAHDLLNVKDLLPQLAHQEASMQALGALEAKFLSTKMDRSAGQICASVASACYDTDAEIPQRLMLKLRESGAR